MSRVSDWFGDFYLVLTERLPRADWPEDGSGYWDNFKREMIQAGARWPEADEAVRRVCRLPKLFLSDVLPLVMAEVRKVQREPSAESQPTDRPSIEAASRHCPECGGTGMAVRHVHEAILGMFKTSRGSDLPVGSRLAIPCSCPLGRLLARPGPDGGKARPTIDEVPALRRVALPWADTPDGLDNQFRHRPDDWCEPERRPYADESDAVRSVADLRALVGSIARKPPHGSPGAPAARGWSDRTTRRQDRHHEAPGPVPGRPDLAGGIGDPVIDRELGLGEPDQPAPPEPAPASLDADVLEWM